MSQVIKNLASGPVPPSVPTSFLLDDGNSAVPAANVLEVLGGSGTFTSLGVSNQIKINVVNDGFPWSDKAISFSAFSQNGYFCTGLLTASLPVSAGLSNGATIIFYVDTASSVTIRANAGQQINIGSQLSSVAGTAFSNAEGSTLTLVFRIADSNWHGISSLGSWSTT